MSFYFDEEDFDFIDSYVELLGKITDSPIEFIRASAIFLVSTFVGRRFQFMSLPDSPIFKQTIDPLTAHGRLLNVWFVLIGKSRITRKSTVINRALELIEMIDEDLLLPTDFTPQAFVKVMSEKLRDGETRAVWIHDEISGFFEQLRKTDFMVSTDAILSKIYDGTNFVRNTIGRGTERIVNPYLTVLVASTEYLPTLFDEIRLRQGFLNRFIYVVGRRERRLTLRHALENEEEREATKLYTWLATLYNRREPVFMNFDTDAKAVYDEYEEEIENKIENEDLGIYEGYYGNLPNFLVKLSSLFRVSRMTEMDLQTFNSPILTIEEKDILRAKSYIYKVWNWFEETVKMMRTTGIAKPVLTEENKLEMVYNIIKKHGGKIDRSTLYRESKLLASELEEVLETLISQNRVVKQLIRTSGRPRIEYVIAD